MDNTYPLRAALFHDATPVLPRPGFAFRRTGRKIIFIGFNKTATSSLAMLMMASGILTIHSSGNGKLFGRPEAEQATIPHATRHIKANLDAQRPPLHGLEGYDVFIDLTVGPHDLNLRFAEFHAAYPDALFILNTRSVQGWLASRRAHKKLVQITAKYLVLRPWQVLEKWRNDFATHHANARTYFARNAPDQFFEWPVSAPPEQLATFFARHDIPLAPSLYFHIRETGGLFLPPPLKAIAHPTEIPILPSNQP
ncbi:sulfotransferase [Shimia abyssi]|uniref:Sulfotransferase family protein n=1 Tax=Shimia abyssi TaxID=1662395 RepID=A0A2P8FHI2_9RHOB|nr:sulfotransferase [Shimia abyssi]PSL21214.1 hypothetical protein CLV88_102334 [Shimia abyssi]